MRKHRKMFRGQNRIASRPKPVKHEVSVRTNPEDDLGPERRPAFPPPQYPLWLLLIARIIGLVSFLMVSLSVISYVLLILIWTKVVAELGKASNADINTTFYRRVMLVVVGSEAWIIYSLNFALLAMYERFLNESGLRVSPRRTHPMVEATYAFVSACFYSAMNVFWSTIHQFVMEEVLRCPTDRLGINLNKLFLEVFENVTVHGALYDTVDKEPPPEPISVISGESYGETFNFTSIH